MPLRSRYSWANPGLLLLLRACLLDAACLSFKTVQGLSLQCSSMAYLIPCTNSRHATQTGSLPDFKIDCKIVSDLLRNEDGGRSYRCYPRVVWRFMSACSSGCYALVTASADLKPSRRRQPSPAPVATHVDQCPSLFQKKHMLHMQKQGWVSATEYVYKCFQGKYMIP